MKSLSVVIISKNEAAKIGATIDSVKGLTDDVVVYDNGSTDETVEIARKKGAHVYEGAWEGFGATKKKATGLAKYDWILSLDADEPIDEELKNSLISLQPGNENVVYEL